VNPRPRKKVRHTPPIAQGTVLPQYSPPQYQQQQQVPSGFNQLLGAVEFVASRDSGYGKSHHAPQYPYQQETFIDPMLESFDVSRSPVSAMHSQPNDMQRHQLHQYHSPQMDNVNFAAYASPQYNTPHTTTPSTTTPAQPMLPCSCLADHYLITSRLQTAESGIPDLDFTAALSSRLHIHRDALRIAHSILLCPYCSRSFMAGAHNVMMIISLLTSIALSYKKLIEDIKCEAQRATNANELKHFMMSESVGEPARPGTPAGGGVDVALTPMEWQMLMLSTMRRDIYPLSAGDSHYHQPPDTRNALTLSELVVAMEERQRHNHQTCPDPYKNDHDPQHHHEEDYNCLRMVKHVRGVMESLEV
jgi:hypothetical protein